MLSQGYHRSDTDQCLYTKQAKDGNLLILILYVNEMLIARIKMIDIVNLKSKLNNMFDMKYLGKANHILGMHIVHDREKKVLFLSQSKYIGKVLMHFNMEGGNLASYVKLSLYDCPTFDVKWQIW